MGGVKAVQLTEHGSPGKFELREVPEPKAGPGEVVVAVQSAGLNRLDLWLEQGALPVKINLPRTPGGEVAGKVMEVGEGVAEWKPGDAVAVQSNLFCGQCEFCRRGDESLCLRGQLLGVNCDGGFAEKVLVSARTLVRLPEGIDFDTSAALTLAGSTAMHMLTNRTNVNAGDWVLVMGASSGVGSAAIQIAKGLGARVITTASSEAKMDLAKRLGADFVVDSNDAGWPAEVRRITEKRGVDLVVEHIGGEVLQRVFDCLARGGTVVTCGATAGREVTLQLWPFFVKQQRLIGSYGRNRADIQATLEWAAVGRLKPVIDSIYPLDRTAEAFAHLRARKVLGKVLIDPFEAESESD
jgi:2-desacetyl-2-hydroxyethyl bacteriochlorophyllide A dehydrogenase